MLNIWISNAPKVGAVNKPNFEPIFSSALKIEVRAELSAVPKIGGSGIELQAVSKAQASQECNYRPLLCSQRLIIQKDFRRSFDFGAYVMPSPEPLPSVPPSECALTVSLSTFWAR